MSNIKSPRAYAPWMKDEADEFEDLLDKDIDKYREDLADKSLIHAVKTIAELTRDQVLKAYSNHPRVTPRF
jgi:predicted aldo/keto reductase-like oxidoreductase